MKETPLLRRDCNLPFVYLIDHCFQIKGKGCVVTGTVIQGKIEKGMEIELPEINFKGKIKSIQRFKKAIDSASQGDRVGMLINNLNSELVR